MHSICAGNCLRKVMVIKNATELLKFWDQNNANLIT